MGRSRGPRWAVTTLLAAPLLVVAPSPASASCAAPTTPSPFRFVGTVIDVEEEGRVATVVTDTGRQVTVLGTEDPGWFSNAYSSIDRRYARGARYEFHPRNGDSPYRDDACTATEHLAGPELPQVTPPPQRLPGWLPVDEQAGPVGYTLLTAAALLPAAAAVAWRRRRRRSRSLRPRQPAEQ